MWVYWVPLLGFESVIFVLAMYKGVEESRMGWSKPRVLDVLLRDSLIYFGAVFVNIVVNLLIWIAARVRRAVSFS